ncbi:MAG: PKD domain-containing protein [Candidatus Thermoplasmatota archaeon]|nr:PKD domain-containing protein [Candidatus Thermoplasmatota archaeon]
MASGDSEGQTFDICGDVPNAEGAVSYEWYKDGVLFEEGVDNVRMTFSESGRHFIGLSVEDSEGKTGYCEEIVWISFDTNPTIHFRYSDIDHDPSMIEFKCWIFEGDGPFTCIWDFGDLSSVTSVPIFGTRPWVYSSISHYYSDPGEYMVTLTVIDEDGDEGYYWDTITLDEIEEW